MDVETRILLKSLGEQLDRLVDAVLGNGHTGLIIRVDRIEQKEENRKNLDIRLDRLERRAATKSKLVWTLGTIAAVTTGTSIATIIFS